MTAGVMLLIKNRKYKYDSSNPIKLTEPSPDSVIRKRWELKAEQCTIIGEGYAQRQIADTLSKVERIKTEL